VVGRERQTPIKVIDLEISEPIVDVSSDRGADLPARGVRAIVRLHGVPIGLVDARFDDIFVTGEALARLVARDLTEAISNHLVQDGFPMRTLTGGASRRRCGASERVLDLGPRGIGCRADLPRSCPDRVRTSETQRCDPDA